MKTRHYKIKKRGLQLNYLIMFLNTIKRKRRFVEFFNANPLKFKQSFIKYLNYCIEKGFIKKTKYSSKHSEFKITKKGKNLLKMLK